MIESLEEAFDCDRALVFGIGGGGDVVGAVPTARLLELFGVEVVLGGVTWERYPYDPEPGPRSLDEINNIERVSKTVGLANSETRTETGVEFTESRVARHYSEEVGLIDLTKGVNDLVEGLEEARKELDIDLIVGTDSGGDALAKGDEEGLRSPLADSISLAALDEVQESVLGVFGYGSDGELSIESLDSGVKRAAERDGWLGSWGLTRRVVEDMEGLLETVGTTEASKLPVEAAKGKISQTEIRDGKRKLRLTPTSTMTLYFDPSSVFETSEIAQRVKDSESVEDAHERLSEMGLSTELDYEWCMQEEGGEKEER